MPNIVPNAHQLIGAAIDNANLRLLQPLGRGSGGVVFRAIDNSTAQEYAVKCLVRAPRGSRQCNFQERELQFHRATSGHRNIITLHRVIEEGPYIFIVLDYYRGGDLFKFLTEKGTYRRNSQLVKEVFVQLIDAVEACHKHGIFHRDIKPENIMCNDNGTQLRLGDFGLATDSRWSRNFGAGTAGYMSPECIGILGGPDSYCTRSNDVWSLGVILTSMISGHNPWRRAVLTDDCFRAYVNNPGFFREMLPISLAADAILRRIFTNAESRVSLSKLRRLVLEVDTFFMSDEEIALSSTYVQMAAVSYLCNPRSRSSEYGRELSGGGVVVDGEITCYQEKAVGWSAKERLEEVNLSPIIMRSTDPTALHLVPGIHNLESHRIRDILKRPTPPPQPMPSYGSLLQTSSGRMSSPRSIIKPRRTCGSDSPVGFLQRLMDRIFV